MSYLTPADYAAFGLPAETADAWVATASAMMEAHCRRPTLLAASYTERLRLPERPGCAPTVCLSYGPLVSVDAVRVQYRRSAPGLCSDATLVADAFSSAYAGAFNVPGQWVAIDPTTLDICLPTAEVTFAGSGLTSLLGMRCSQAEITYTGGLATVPDALKVACAQIVRNAQATPGLNVRSSRMDTLATQYFSDSLLDSQVQALLRPYVAERLG